MSRNQRSRRPDSTQMWEEQDRKAPIPSRERDEPRREDRSGRGRDDRDYERDRNRRYRSRSPRGGGRGGDRHGRNDRDRGDRDRERERGGRDERERDYRSGGRRDRGRDEGEKDGRGDRESEREGGLRSHGTDIGERGGRSNHGVNQPHSHRDRRERSRPRNEDRDGGHRRDDRSRSPQKDFKREEESDRPRSSRFDNDFSKSRTSTPPVTFKVGTPLAVGEDHMDVDTTSKKSSKNIKVKKDKANVKEEASDEEEILVEDDGMGDMAAMMGFGGFGTTQNQKVSGNNIGGIRKEKKTEYRQYMNRVGGFNRPLSPPK